MISWLVGVGSGRHGMGRLILLGESVFVDEGQVFVDEA